LEALLVSQDAAVDGVGDASFQAAPGFFDGLVFGDLAAVVIAPGTGVAGLTQSIGPRLFIDAILDDRPIEPSFHDGHQVQRIVEAAMESHQTGTSQNL
jgi:hypothetical protein